MFIIDDLPLEGTRILYQFGSGKIHRAVIRSGIVETFCGADRAARNTRLGYPTNIEANIDSWFPLAAYQGQLARCQKCR